MVVISVDGTETRIKEGGFTATTEIVVNRDKIQRVRIEYIGTGAPFQSFVRGVEIQIYGCSEMGGMKKCLKFL